MNKTPLSIRKNSSPFKQDEQNPCQSPITHNYIELRKILKQFKDDNKHLTENLKKQIKEKQMLKATITQLQIKLNQLDQQNKQLIQDHLKLHQQLNKQINPEHSLKIKQCYSDMDENFLQSLVQLDENILLNQRTSTKQLLKLEQIAGDLNESIFDSKEESMLLNSDDSCKQPISGKQSYNFKETKGFKSMISPLKPSSSQLFVKLKPTGAKNNSQMIQKQGVLSTNQKKQKNEKVKDQNYKKLEQKISYLLESNSTLHCEIQRLKQQNYMLRDENQQKQTIILDKRYELSELIKQLNEAKNILQYFSNSISSKNPILSEHHHKCDDMTSNFSSNQLIPVTIAQKNIFNESKLRKIESRNSIAKQISHKMRQVIDKKQNLYASQLEK